MFLPTWLTLFFSISVLFTFACLCSTLFYLLSNVNHHCLLVYEVCVIQELPVVAVSYVKQVKSYLHLNNKVNIQRVR
jgi:hypothetical protein